MHDTDHHTMRLERTYPTSAEEWYCPSCGRRFLMYWQPTYKKLVLEPGNELVSHSGGKGGLSMGSSQIGQQD